jgi:hypothetical protein
LYSDFLIFFSCKPSSFLCCSGTQSNQEKCEEYEEELAGIREDIIDMLGDGWVVKLTDSALLPRYEGRGV